MLLPRPRGYELAPEILLVVGLTIFFVDEPDATTSVFKSSRALALLAIVAVVWLAARLLSVVVPAYDNDTVVETFPTRVQ